MKVPCRLVVSSFMAIALISAAAIAILLVAANVTMANAQQQQQLTSQHPATERGTTTASRSTRDSFRVQVPQGWVIHDVKNTGSALVTEVLDGVGILAQLCPEEEQQQVAFRNSGGNTSNNSISINSDTCQGAQQVIHVIRYPNLGTRLGLTSDDIFAIINRDTIPNAILAYQIQKLQEVGYRNIQIVNSTDTTVNVDISTGLNNNNNNNAIGAAATATTIVPAKLVAMTYSTKLAPNETRIGYFILTATAATPRNLGMITGYSIFYEGNSVMQAVSTGSSLAPPPPTPFPAAVRQVFGSFELLAAPTEPLAVEITSSDTEGVAPATFDFEANVTGGTVPYTYSWDFGDGSVVESGDDETVDHTFDVAGNYTVSATVTDSTGRTVSDSIVVAVHEREPPATEGRMCDPSYPGLCIPPPPPDLDCDNISARNFRVLQPDPHRFDDDNDGIGCPTGINPPNVDNNSGSDNLFDLDDFLDDLFDRLGLR